MELNDFEHLHWLEPWEWIAPGLEDELAREVGPGHRLENVRAIAVGHRTDCDDVLFHLPDHSLPLAVVHLTWSSTREWSAKWPWTVFYTSLDEWIETCMKKDHQKYSG
jgi:hypothetical protein